MWRLEREGKKTPRAQHVEETVDEVDVARSQALAQQVKEACLHTALQAYEDARFNGLCHEGAWEVTVDALRSLDVASLVSP